MVEGIYVVADGESESDEYDNTDTAKNENLLLNSMCNIQCGGLPSRLRKNSMEKMSRGVSVATKNRSSTRQPVDLICSEFPTHANGAVNVDVSCGAMNAFSNDVPYNSAGLSLARSVDTNPGGFLSQHSRRRRLPTLLSSMTSSPTHHSNKNENVIRRRLMTSGIHISVAGRRGTFRSSSPGVERFNYAKALLRSDHELEKLSRKIRSEINESELFELAQAAEEAADLGVNNFSGKASTFGGESHQKQQEELNKIKNKLPLIGILKPLIGDNMSVQSGSVQMPCLSRTTPEHLKSNENSGIENGGSSPVGFSDQSLLDHARAAAAAVVVASPALQLQAKTPIRIHKKPEKRSMRIDSLRDINEVIPQWKELHGHMRTHFYRSNVNPDSLFFGEKEFQPIISSPFSIRKNISSSDNIKDRDGDLASNHRRTKSFFGNIAGIKLLPNFRPMKSPQQTAVNGQPNDDLHKPKASTRMETRESRKLPEENLGEAQSPGLFVPTRGTHSGVNQNVDDFCSNQGASPLVENRDDRFGQVTSLTPRLPERSESFDLDVLQIKGNTLTSPRKFDNNPGIHNNDSGYGDNDGDGYGDGQSGCPSAKNLAASSPTDSQRIPFDVDPATSLHKVGVESFVDLSDNKYICPISPSNDSSLRRFNPRLAGPSSIPSPSTPNNSVVLRRKDSGFSTPAHLRMIKRMHGENNKTNRIIGESFLELTKSEDLQDLKLEDEALTTTPATGVYSQYEPNSIVQTSPEYSPQLQTTSPIPNSETKHLAIPMIQGSKNENDFKKNSRSLVGRIVRTSRQNDSIPHDSSRPHTDSSTPRVLLRRSEREFSSDIEVTSSATTTISHLGTTPRRKSEINQYPFIEDSESLSSSKLMSYISPPTDTLSVESTETAVYDSSMYEHLSDSSVQKIQSNKQEDEKKECNDDMSRLDPNAHSKREDEHHKCVLNLYPARIDKQNEINPGTWQDLPTDDDEKEPFLLRRKNISSPLSKNDTVLKIDEGTDKFKADKALKNEASLTTKRIETVDNPTIESKNYLSTSLIKRHDVFNGHNYATDATSGDNLSVCQSLPSTEVTFKSAVQTVQGVAVQTVQEVFSHLSLGSPKNQIRPKQWESEDDNKEFLNNYFYCAKSLASKKSRHFSANHNSAAQVNALESNGERLVCTEPCNGVDTPCYLFGIDTMCGGLMNLIPRDMNVNSGTRNEREHDQNVIAPEAATRDRTSSISVGQTHQRRRKSFSGIGSSEHSEEQNWLGVFQRVASERFHFKFQTEENELEKSRHPYTPPCLSRKVPTQNQTL